MHGRPPDNAGIAAQLDQFASLLELAGSGPYTARAYRRAADLIRTTLAPVAELVLAGRARELRGIGPGIDRRLRELVETGQIAELQELEREVSPELAGLGRFLGVSVKRMLEIGRVLGVRTLEELRAAAAEGRLQEVPGIGPETERKLLAALARDPGTRSVAQPLLLHRSRPLVESIAGELGGVAAGDPRRWRDASEQLAVVVPAERPGPVLERFAGLPQIVAVVDRGDRGALGVTVEGVPVELVVAEPARLGTELVRATGSPEWVAAHEPLPDAPDEEGVFAALGLPFVPPELRESGAPETAALVEVAQIRGDLHCHSTWSDGRATILEMGLAARERGYDYLAICDHTVSVGAVPGLDADGVRRQAEEIAAANEQLAPFRILRGTECDIQRDGTLDLPDDVLAELDWVQASVHAGQRGSREELTKRVLAALDSPYVS